MEGGEASPRAKLTEAVQDRTASVTSGRVDSSDFIERIAKC